MISFDEAIELVVQAAGPLAPENIPLDGADGRYLADEIVAPFNSPAQPVSAMDGYAVRDADLATLPARLSVVGKSFAGRPFCGELSAGNCVRVFTGANVPAGTDRVVMQEDVCLVGDVAHFSTHSSKHRHLRRIGSDFQKGDVLVAAGCVLNPQRLIAAAAADLSHVQVVRRPRLSIISCGDELSAPGCKPCAPNSIPESVSFGVAAMARRWGASVVGRSTEPDDLNVLQLAARAAVENSDVVVVIGGASVGEKDFAKAMFAPLGLAFIFNKVAIKPGKPVWMGRVGERVIVGLPGNPTSALVTARLFLAPLLSGMAGGSANAALCWRLMPAPSPLDTCADRDTFVRANMDRDIATLLANQDSSAQKAVAECDTLIHYPAGGSTIPAGAAMKTLQL